LAAFLAEFHPEKVRMIFGSMRDKKYTEMLQRLRPHTREIVLTRASNARSIEPETLLEIVPDGRVETSVSDAIAHMRGSASPSETILVCGSLYLVGEARAILK